MSARVFWAQPLDTARVWLRAYRYNDGAPCVARQNWVCEAAPVVLYQQAPREEWIEDLPDGCHRSRDERIAKDDPRWPTRCAACGLPLGDGAQRQLWAETLHGGAPDGQLFILREAPVGAMWDVAWMRGRRGGNGEMWTGPDGISLCVKTPGGEWLVDSQASNCTRDQWGPKEIDGKMHARVWLGRTHYCWVRHGDPRRGECHVDKNGNTCAAGAGSIIAGGWHGFLHNNFLVPC